MTGKFRFKKLRPILMRRFFCFWNDFAFLFAVHFLSKIYASRKSTEEKNIINSFFGVPWIARKFGNDWLVGTKKEIENCWKLLEGNSCGEFLIFAIMKNFSIDITFNCSFRFSFFTFISHLQKCNKFFDEIQITKLNASYFSISMIYEFESHFNYSTINFHKTFSYRLNFKYFLLSPNFLFLF